MFKRANAYGDTINSYDIFKLIALLTMVIDHLGVFFWPHEEYLRTIGRIAFPLFLFLVGYSGAWKVKPSLVISAVLVVLCAVLTGHSVFPMNVLVTIIITRYIMGLRMMRQTTPAALLCFILFCISWYFPFYWCDYSTVALLFAMCGLLQRQEPGSIKTLIFIYITVGVHFIMQYLFFRFHLPAAIGLFISACIVAYLMQHFCLRTYSMQLITMPMRDMLLWCSRNTLPLYALHLILLMVIDRLYHPHPLGYFHWWQTG